MWLRGIDMKWTNILNNILSSEMDLVAYQIRLLQIIVKPSVYVICDKYKISVFPLFNC